MVGSRRRPPPGPERPPAAPSGRMKASRCPVDGAIQRGADGDLSGARSEYLRTHLSGRAFFDDKQEEIPPNEVERPLSLNYLGVDTIGICGIEVLASQEPVPSTVRVGHALIPRYCCSEVATRRSHRDR